MKTILITIFLSALFIGCSNNTKKSEDKNKITPTDIEIPTLDYSIVKTFPHDTTSYTQGLIIHDRKIIESTGSPKGMKQTRSVFGILDTITGKINIKAELDRDKYFGEGIVELKNKIYQLTYLNQVGFIYDAKTFKLLGQFSFANKEGWGLTTDGTYLIMSDGTNKLSYLDPSNFKLIKTLEVPYSNLNELEFIKGYIYANVYFKNYIVKIDPANGNVIALLDLYPLVSKAREKSAGAEVLNGIAFDSISDRIFVTGKLWKNMYQIDFKH